MQSIQYHDGRALLYRQGGLLRWAMHWAHAVANIILPHSLRMPSNFIIAAICVQNRLLARIRSVAAEYVYWKHQKFLCEYVLYVHANADDASAET